MATERLSTKLDWALAYARQGWRVHPVWWVIDGVCQCSAREKCKSPGKHPITRWMTHEPSTTDEETIRLWWKTWPDANIGIATGEESNLIVLDVDGEKGQESLEKLEEEHEQLPDTPEVNTGGGGWHLWFKWLGFRTKNSVSKIAPGLDIRGDGGYIIAPPSVHVSGNEYQWQDKVALKETVAKCPEWLVSRIQQAEAKFPPEKMDVDKILSEGLTKGERDEEANRYAWKLASKLEIEWPEAVVLMRQLWKSMEQPEGDEFTLDEALEKLKRAWPVHRTSNIPVRPLRQTATPLFEVTTKAYTIPIDEWAVQQEKLARRLKESGDFFAFAPPLTQEEAMGERLSALDVVRIRFNKPHPGIDYIDIKNFQGMISGYVEYAEFEEQLVKDDTGRLVPSGVTVVADGRYFIPIPQGLIKSFLSSQARWHLPPLKTIEKNPTYDENWELVDNPGYDSERQIYFIGKPAEVITDHETIHHVFDDELLEGFERIWRSRPTGEGQHSYDKVNYLAMLLTLVTKNVWMRYGKPFWVADGNMPGVGKTLLGDMAVRMIDAVLMKPITYKEDDLEFEKTIGGWLRRCPADSVCVIDNVRTKRTRTGPQVDEFIEMDSSFLAKAITEPIIVTRLLHYSDLIARPNNIVFFVTVNRAQLTKELIRRSVPVRLAAEGFDPTTRRDFKRTREEQLRWVEENRGLLLGCLLGMVENWKEWERKDHKPYKDLATHSTGYKWANTMDEILRVNGYYGLLKNFEGWRIAADRYALIVAELAEYHVGFSGTALEWYELMPKAFKDFTKDRYGYPMEKDEQIGSAVGKVMKNMVYKPVKRSDGKSWQLVDRKYGPQTYYHFEEL